MADPVLLTTSVGSFPKPDYITKARAEASRGKMPRSELQGLEQRATEEWIRFQEDLGVDILVDGEMYRGDMAAYFAENLEGFELGGAVRSYGNRYYQKPIAIGEVRRPNSITVEWWQYAQSLTNKPVKGMLTGPYTIADWSFDEHYGSREDFVMALADVIHAEAVDLQAAGAQYIQIDEPAISVRPEEFDIARRAFEVVTAGLSATTLTHICYGDFSTIYPAMLDLPVEAAEQVLREVPRLARCAWLLANEIRMQTKCGVGAQGGGQGDGLRRRQRVAEQRPLGQPGGLSPSRARAATIRGRRRRGANRGAAEPRRQITRLR